MAAPEGPKIEIPDKDGKQVNYIWMPDGKGNLVKTDSSVVKKGFANLPAEAQIQLAQYILTVTNRQPTAAARENLWNDIIRGAEAKFKEGIKDTPWDVLTFMTENAPPSGSDNVIITKYDKITSDAYLNNVAKSLGFDVTLLTEEDKTDFLNKINAEAAIGGKQTTKKATTGGYETIVTPAIFDPKSFTEAFIWAKVNIGDTKTLPSSAVKQVANVQTMLKNYGINNLSAKEINQYAVDVASGTKTLDDLMLDFSDKAQRIYGQFADRLKANPKLTMADIAEPIVTTLSKVWEMDPTSFSLSDPNVSRFLVPDITGKMPASGIADVYNYAMNHPNREKTKAANDEARSAATEVARAMGFGI